MLSCTLALLALLGSSARALQGPTPCASGVGCQLPDQQGWSLSDQNPGGPYATLDNLRVVADGTISAVCWWGEYYDWTSNGDCAPGAGDDFTITYFEDACMGLPGALRAGPFHVGAGTKLATGDVAASSGVVLTEYRYEATHAPVAVQAGECLWIQIANETSGTCVWLWGTGRPADGRAFQIGVFGATMQAFDMAFCVDVATAPEGCPASLATTYCTAKTNSSGCTPSAAATVSTSQLVLTARQVLPGEPGLCFYSVTGGAASPFQGGVLCVQPPIVRTPAKAAGGFGAPPCTGTYSFNMTAWQASGVDPALVGGQQVWAQFWSRDPNAGFGSGLTDALTFVLCP